MSFFKKKLKHFKISEIFQTFLEKKNFVQFYTWKKVNSDFFIWEKI